MKINFNSDFHVYDMRRIKRDSARYCDCCKICSHGNRIRRGGITSIRSLGILGPVERKVKLYNRKRAILKPLGLRLSQTELINLYVTD